jgi:hypothetical protein
VKDQHLTSDKGKEPERPGTIPADFIWDPEIEAWYAPGETSDCQEWLKKIQEDLARINQEMLAKGIVGPQLISRDQLLAAGALYVPPAWRKSLSNGPDDLFSDLPEDDENAENQQPESGEPDS